MKSTRAFQALILAVLGLFLLERIWSGKLLFYVNQRSVIVVAVAAVALVGLAQVVFQRRVEEQQGEPEEGGEIAHSHIKEQESGEQIAYSQNGELKKGEKNAHSKNNGSPGRSALVWMLVPILVAILVPARPLSTSVIANRGINTTSALAVRGGDASVALELPSSQRTILDWIRAFTSTTSAENLVGQEADVIGFVYHDGRLAKGQFMAGRFTITCCVADALALGMVVSWSDAASLPDNGWVRITGKVEIAEVAGQKLPMIRAVSVDSIPEPQQPYIFP